MISPDQWPYAVVTVVCMVAATIGALMLVRGVSPGTAGRGFSLESESPADRATVRFGRQRHWPLAVVGGVVCVIGLTIAGLTTYCWLEGVPIIRYKPFWWLRLNLTSADAALNRRAHTEMRRRSLNAELSASQRASLVAEALNFQTNASLPWDQQWDQYIVDQQRDGRLSPQDWHRYVAATKWTLEPIASPFVSRSDYDDYNRLQVDVRYRASRGLVTGEIELSNSIISLDGRTLPLVKIAARNAGIGSVTLSADPTAVLTELDDGTHQGLLQATACLHLPDGTMQESTLRTPFTVTLSGANYDRGTFLHDQAVAAAIQSAIHLKLRAISRSADFTNVRMTLWIDSNALPHTVAFRVFAMVNQEPRLLGRFACKMNQPPSGNEWTTSLPIPGDCRSLTLELQPDARIAMQLNAMPIWDGGIILKDVPIAE